MAQPDQSDASWSAEGGETVPNACLPFARARSITLDHTGWHPGEAAHVEGCRRCGRLLELFAREMPHLSSWLLLRSRLGRPLLPLEQHAIDYHLRAGGCRECAVREERLARLSPHVMVLSGNFPLPASRMLAAATVTAEARAASLDSDLEAELAVERDRLGLEIRTRNPRWQAQLFGWTLATRRDRVAIERFTVLRPDVDGWFADHAWLDLRELRVGTHNPGEELLAGPVDVDLLAAAQQENLLISVLECPPDRVPVWRQWASRQAARADLAPATREVLARVLACLQQ